MFQFIVYDKNRTQIFTDKLRSFSNLKYGLFDLCASLIIRVLFKNSNLTIPPYFVQNFNLCNPVCADLAAGSE